MLVESKWASRSVGIDIFQELEGKTAAILHETGNQKITYTICSRSGFTKRWVLWQGNGKIFNCSIGLGCYPPDDNSTSLKKFLKQKAPRIQYFAEGMPLIIMV